MQIERIAQLLKPLTSVCCLTGAGISAESGIPTFRDAGGLWEGRRPEEVATPDAFRRDPEGVWSFYRHRIQSARKCQPNPGHYALAQFEKYFEDWTIITQNVDQLHQTAGSNNVIELHGNILTSRCCGCGRKQTTLTLMEPELPLCAECGNMLRPDVVWFGELLPEAALLRAEVTLTRCQAMLVIGTSAVVQPAASMAYLAKSHQAIIIEINTQNTPLSADADHCLRGPSGRILPAILEELMPDQKPIRP